MNQKAFEPMNYGLSLVAATANGKRQGCIVSSFAQVTSSNPARFTITLNRDHETCKAVAAAGSFAVTLLASNCPRELVNQFGYKSGRVGDKFKDFAAETDGAGNPYLTDHMVSRISCKVTGQMEIGSYVLYVGEVTEAELLGGGEVLTLKAFTDEGRPIPPSATVVRNMEGDGFRCSVCGYVHESETLSPDFICPICRATADKFVKI
ncbi:MAG: flavin reductase [Oscillospiraceae bacterium]